MTANLVKPKAVLFDWDGTVVDSFRSTVEGYKDVFGALGKETPTDKEVLLAMASGTSREIFGGLFPGQVDEALQVFYAGVEDRRKKYVSVIDGAATTLEYLQTHDIPCGIVSNMTHDLLVNEVDRLGLSTHFKSIVGAGKTPKGKPDPAVVFYTAAEMGLDKNDLSAVWFVGDMDPDARAARAAGCAFLLFDPENDAAKQQRLAPDYTFSKYADINKLLDKALALG